MTRWLTPVLAVAIVGTSACAELLGFPSRSAKHAFEHREHANAGVHCLSCHTGVERTASGEALHLPDMAKCVSCHKKPHDSHECGECHGLPYTRASAVRAKETLRFDHASHSADSRADCVRCHADAGTGAAVMRPRMADCLGCHGHESEFASKNCNACHRDLRNEGTLPDDHFVHGADFANNHASAAQRSDGMCNTCHAERFCASCHTGSMMPIVPARLAFDSPRAGGLHPAGFIAKHADASKDSPGLCTSCHAPESCASCHARNKLTATQAEAHDPHPPGWVGPRGSPNAHGQAAWRDPASCEGCHGGAGERLCVECHQVGGGGGNPHMPGSAPVGNRTAQPCVLCHLGGR